MKHSIIAFAIAAMIPMSLAAADCPYDITWYQGKIFSGAVQMPNRTAKAFQSVYGVFPTGTEVKVSEGKTASISGPADSYLNKTPKIITEVSKSYQDPAGSGDWIKEVYPGFGVSFTTSEFYSINTPGVYTLTVPAGSFTVNGTDNVEFDVEFLIEDNRVFTPTDLTMTANPGNGYSADKFSEFMLTVSNTFNDGKKLFESDGVKAGSKLKLTDLATNEVFEFDIKTTAATTSNLGYKASCDPVIRKGGEYKVEWPEGFMMLIDTDGKLTGGESKGSLYTNKAHTFTITCTGTGDNDKPVTADLIWAEGNQWATQTPVVNNTVNALGTLWGIYNNNKIEVPHPNSAEAKKAVVTGPAAGFTSGKAVTIDQVKVLAADGVNTEFMNAFKVLIAGAPTYVETPGDYTVAVPEGAFKIDGVANAAIEYKVTVKDTRSYQPIDLPIDRVTPTPDGATSTTQGTLQKITINIKNEAVNGKRPYGSLGVSQTVKPIITLPDGSSKSFDLISLGSYSDNIRFMVGHNGDYGYTAAGKYTLTVPQGAILLYDANKEGVYYTNKELSYYWTLDGNAAKDFSLAVSPSTKDVQSLAGIEVSSPDDYFLKVNDPSLITVTTPSGETKQMTVLVSPNELYLNCFRENEIFTQAGTYNFNIGIGAISFADTNGNAVVSTKSYSMAYNVKGGTVGNLEYAISNEKNETVTDNSSTYLIHAFYVKFEKPVTATVNSYCTVIYPDNSKHYVKATWSQENERFQLYMDFPKQIGAYKISFPAGAAMADGVFNSQIDFTVNLLDKGEEDLVLTTTPENNSTVSELSVIAVKGSAELYTELSAYRGGITMTYFQNDDNPDSRQMQYLKASANDPLRYTIELNETVTEVGDYTWTIPSESLLAVKKDGTQVMGKEVKFYWSVRENGAVDTICAGDATVSVYDMNGVCLMRDAAREELAKLPKGMYVINGRTFILK